MKSIQEAGLEILNGNPTKFYIFAGPEYGIKCKYIESIQKHYNNKIILPDSVDSIFKQSKTKNLIPQPPSLYVVRYDTEFINNLSKNYVEKLNINSINGTLVCIYEDQKQVEKLEKFFPDYVVPIENVNNQFIVKYLADDFPNLDNRLIQIAANSGRDYNQAKNIAYCMSMAPDSELDKHTDEEIAKLFGINKTSDSNKVKIGTASKDFKSLLGILSTNSISYDDIIYNMMNAILELDRIKNYKQAQTPLFKYKNLWTDSDIYYMYENCYNTLHTIRLTSSNVYDILVELITTLAFKQIPSLQTI